MTGTDANPVDQTSTTASRVRRYRRAALALALPAALTGGFLAAAAPAQAAPQSFTQVAAGGETNWVVPAATYSVTLTVAGGSGADGTAGSGGAPGGAGGYGALVTETLAVHPGQVFSLQPGWAATDRAGGNGWTARDGGDGGYGDLDITNLGGGDGGGGGAGSAVALDNTYVAFAGGGGGGGGGGIVLGYDGGTGGTAQQWGANGSGVGAGSGGQGWQASQLGQNGSQAGSYTYAGGPGGGGGGWNGSTVGGGYAGTPGRAGGGGGGGGAGGLSTATGSNVSYRIAGQPGDGYVTVSWTPGVPTTSTLTGPATAPYGTDVALVDTVADTITGAPAPTGTITFQDVNRNDFSRTVIGVAPLVNGVATLHTSTLGYGQHDIQAIYNGDSSAEASTSNFVYPTVITDVKTLSVSPGTTLDFGKHVVGTTTKKTVTVTNTGNIAWYFQGASTDNADVNLPAETCGVLSPGQSCTLTVSFSPHAVGAVTGHITIVNNFAPLVLTATGAGTGPKPTVTAISPKTGPAAGGTVVTITGTNLGGATAVKIGTVKMTHVSCTATTCTATTPKGTGAQAIRVTTPAGVSAATPADVFTYHA